MNIKSKEEDLKRLKFESGDTIPDVKSYFFSNDSNKKYGNYSNNDDE
jgi:hypothetical protein